MLSSVFISYMESFLKDNNFSFEDFYNQHRFIVVDDIKISFHPAFNNYDEIDGFIYHFEKDGKKEILNGKVVSREARELPINVTDLERSLKMLGDKNE